MYHMNLPTAFQKHIVFNHPLFEGRLPADLDEAARKNFDELWRLHPADFHQATIHGRTITLPRWQQAYEHDYRYTGSINRALPAPPLLRPFLAWGREAIDARLNGLLLNWYDPDRSHYIGPHRDSRISLVPGAPIVTISIGAARVFRQRPFKGTGFRDFDATHGVVFVMPFDTNLAVKHEVPKGRTGRRISITLRAFADQGN
jgi:alkylated DNA repair dioxygenase AlkB